MRALGLVAAVILVSCGSSPRAAAPAPAAAPPVAAPAPAAPAAPAAPDRTGVRVYDFEADAAGVAPAGFTFHRTGRGRPGAWVVRDEAGGKVLAQEDLDPTDYRFPLAVAEGPELRDVRLSVRCKPVSGTVDRAAGLVFRWRGEDDYYLTRANALEGNVRLYWVKGGQRQEIASWKGRVEAGAWHDFRVEARGDSLVVHWDGAPVLDTRDSTIRGAGRVGLWTKADSGTLFDDLRVEPLGE